MSASTASGTDGRAAGTRSGVPDHVPTSMVWERDYSAFLRELEDPFVAGCRLHDGPDIVWTSNWHRGQKGWLVTRHALIEEILLDHRRFSGARGDMKEILGYDIRFYPLDCDPPVHHRYRQTIAPVFTPSAVKQMDDGIRAICVDLVSGLARSERCEFIGEFASLLPSYVFLELVGMPRVMLPQFMAWNAAFVRGEGGERIKAARAILGYLEGFLADQRSNPARTNLMDAILGSRSALEPFDANEALGTVYMLYVAGLDTVFSTVGWLVAHLASDLKFQDHLRSNPADIGRAIDELTRAYSVSTTTRLVTSDFDFHGVPMRAGDTVIMPLYLATRDPRVFHEPHEIHVERRARHLTFGGGAHICLGFHLAKRELVIVLETLLAAFSEFRLDGTGEFHTDGPVLGLDLLPLRLTAAGRVQTAEEC